MDTKVRKTFTKIRNWAKKHGYTIEDVKRHCKMPCMKVFVTVGTRVLEFEVELRESTIYYSIHGRRGKPKGLYITAKWRGRSKGVHYSSQIGVIHAMEKLIREEKQVSRLGA